MSDSRAEATAQHKLKHAILSSPRVATQRKPREGIRDSARAIAERHQIRELFGKSSASVAPVQRVIKTAGGVWDTTEYEVWGPGRPPSEGGGGDEGVGATISLHFTPGSGAPFYAKIGLIQSVKALANDKPNPTGWEAVELDDDGRAIDRDYRGNGADNTSPLYGAMNIKTSKGGKSPRVKETPKLSDNIKSDNKSSAYGMRYRFSKNKPATLWDEPSSVLGKVSKEFETSAVVLEGRREGTYLGSVGWGYKFEPGHSGPEKLPFRKLTDGNPTVEFMAAAQKWNDQKVTRNERRPLVQVPIPKEK